MSEPAPTPEAEPKESHLTTYVVLQLDAANPEAWNPAVDRWMLVGEAEAANDQQAIKAVIPIDEQGTFVGVPKRSWRPRKREFDRSPRERWS